MAAVGVAVVELAALLDQHPRHALVDQRRPAAGSRWSRPGKVTRSGWMPNFRTEPVAQAAEAADHLVGDQQDAVAVDDALHLGQ